MRMVANPLLTKPPLFGLGHPGIVGRLNGARSFGGDSRGLDTEALSLTVSPLCQSSLSG